MKRIVVGVIAALALAAAPAAAQTTVGLEALSGLSDRAYSFGAWAKIKMVVPSIDIGHHKHEIKDNPDATHRDRLQVIGAGVEVGPVVVGGHFGQSVCAETLNLMGASLRVKQFTVRALFLDHEKAENKMYLQAGFQLPLGTLGG